MQLPTRGEMAAAQAAQGKANTRKGRWLIPLCVCALGAMFLLAHVLDAHHWPMQVRLLAGLAAGGVLAACAAAVIAYFLWFRRSYAAYGLVCPFCKAFLRQDVVLFVFATGRCAQCGQTIVTAQSPAIDSPTSKQEIRQLPTREKAIAFLSDCSKSSQKRARWLLGAFGAVFLLWYSPVFFLNSRAWPKWLVQLWFGTLLAAMAGSLVWNLRSDRRAAKERNAKAPRCPFCGLALAGPRLEVAVASGGCPQCGERVFAEGPNSSASEAYPAGEPPLTRQQFGARLQAHRRASLWSTVVLLGAVFPGTIAVGMVAYPMARSFHYADAPLWHLLLELVALAIVGGCVLVIPVLWSLRRANKRMPHCPSCTAPLRAWLVQATGRCQACGNRVLADETG